MILAVLGVLGIILVFSFIPPAYYHSVREQVTNCDTGGSGLSGRSDVHFRFFSPLLP